MNYVDGIVLAWLVVAVLRGYSIGIIRQAASFIGFVLGAIAGSFLVPALLVPMQEGSQKLVVTLIATLGFGIVGSALLEAIAVRLQSRLRLDLTKRINALLGAVFSAVTTFILAWLLLSGLNRLPLAETGLLIAESRTYAEMQRIMPPAPPLLDRLGRLITPNGFPQVFVQGEPGTAAPIAAEASDVEAAAAKAQNGVVRIEGYACGDIRSGSGFVAAPGYVVTNAHVLAGVKVPIVVRGNQKFRAATVLFDDDLDIAVLRVEELNAPVLPLTVGTISRGQSGAVMGYPGGGSLTAFAGVVVTQYQALGRNIYGTGLVSRGVYEIQAQIYPGNSGGPFVLPDGTVGGVMFGASTSQPTTSYAIASNEVADKLRRAMAASTAVSTKYCLENI